MLDIHHNKERINHQWPYINQSALIKEINKTKPINLYEPSYGRIAGVMSQGVEVFVKAF